MKRLEYKNFVIEKLSETKIKDALYLYEKSFNTNIGDEFLRNKHINCHGKNKFIAFLAYDKESLEPAAYYAVYPGFLKINDELILVAQSGDTMTNPKFQKQGLFTKLAQITFDHCNDIGIQIITGLPNTNSYHGFIKYLNFKEFPKFSNLSFIENKFELNRITNRSSFLKNLHSKFVKFLIKLMFKTGSSFENSNKYNQDLAYMVHDNQFYKLKKQQNDIIISVKNVDVWLRISENSIIIADINTHIEKDIEIIISKLRLTTIMVGFRFLNFGATKNSFLHSKLIPLSKSQSEGYTFIIRDLSSKLSLEKISLLSCDADVF